MTLNDLLHGEVWMSPEEHLTHAQFITALTAQLDARKVPASATLTLRVAEAAHLLHLARRLEKGLIPPPDDPEAFSVTPSLAEHIGKARERLRKVLKEIEDCCVAQGARASRGFADEIRPMLNKGGDLLNDPRVNHETVAEIVPPETDDDGDAPELTRAMAVPAMNPSGMAAPRGMAVPAMNHPGMATPSGMAVPAMKSSGMAAPRGMAVPAMNPLSKAGIPSVPSVPDASSVPSVPSAPSAPSVPSVPSVPSHPAPAKKPSHFWHTPWYTQHMKHHMLRFVFAISLLVVLALSGCASRPKPERGMRASTREMSVSAYCSCKQCCNWKRNWLLKPVIADGPSRGHPKKVGVTASGTKAQKGTIAADTQYYPFGTIMHIPGYGYGRVEDRGSAIKGPDKIDLYFPKHKKALQWGRRRAPVKIWQY